MSVPLSPTRTVLLVARREFVTQVRSRSFVIGIIITIVLFAGIALLTAFIGGQSSTRSLGLTPGTTDLRTAIEETARVQGADLEIRSVDDAAGRGQVDADELDALLSGSPGGYELLGRDSVDAGVQSIVATAIQQRSLTAALSGAGVDPAQVAAQSQVTVATVEPVDPDGGQQLGLALAATILLFFSLNYASAVASGVVEEKQSRVVELLLAAIKPWQLLAGKILGLGAVGLLTLVILGGISAVGASAAGILTLPAAAAGIFAMAIGWYLLGFFLFAAVYAAIGSTVSRQEDLQSVIAPMIFVLIIPFILTVNLLPGDPRNPITTVLSFVPFFSQTVMPARYALGVAPLWEVGVAALLELLAILVVVRVAGRVYENSILRTGARVKLLEALRVSR